jgi:integrase
MKEMRDHDERLPFTFIEIGKILKAVTAVTAHLAKEWVVFLLIMLYTEMRPSDAKKIKRKDITKVAGIGVIRVTSHKTRNFRAKVFWKPMHKCLQRHVDDLLQDLEEGTPLQPDDFLLKHLGNMREICLSFRFRTVLRVAEIEVQTAKGKDRRVSFSPKTLYSIKHTACVWLDNAGAREEEKDEHADLTEQAQEHYTHLGIEDAHLLEIRRRKINGMPDADEAIVAADAAK